MHKRGVGEKRLALHRGSYVRRSCRKNGLEGPRLNPNSLRSKHQPLCPPHPVPSAEPEGHPKVALLRAPDFPPLLSSLEGRVVETPETVLYLRPLKPPNRGDTQARHISASLIRPNSLLWILVMGERRGRWIGDRFALTPALRSQNRGP